MYQDYKNYITADELKIKLDNKEPLILFDIRDLLNMSKNIFQVLLLLYAMKNQTRR